MWVSELNIHNLRCFADVSLTLSRGINILVGRNNCGKSTSMLPLYNLQEELYPIDFSDRRLGAAELQVGVRFAGDFQPYNLKEPLLELHIDSKKRFFGYPGHRERAQLQGQFSSSEPNNFVYAFGAKRKVVSLNESVQSAVVRKISPNFAHLNAKVDRLLNPNFPGHKFYMRACQEVLGFLVGTEKPDNGKRAALSFENLQSIPLLSMGEGVMNVLALVVDLAIAKNKLFLVEEPENDIHPRALKALLDLVAEKATENQFVVSTHSNIVLKRLGALEGSKVFRVSAVPGEGIPTSTITEVPSDTESRRLVLEDLGYEYSDGELWDAWLFLEESSAEKIIREYLIKWFVPELVGKLRTFSCRSLSEVIPKFRDFNDLFVFLHLQQVYKNKVWVVVDGGDIESSIIKKLQDSYEKHGWQREQFLQMSHHDFEQYYPAEFKEKFVQIQEQSDSGKKRKLKDDLRREVEEWIVVDESKAKEAFRTSANDVIAILEKIASKLAESS